MEQIRINNWLNNSEAHQCRSKGRQVGCTALLQDYYVYVITMDIAVNIVIKLSSVTLHFVLFKGK